VSTSTTASSPGNRGSPTSIGATGWPPLLWGASLGHAEMAQAPLEADAGRHARAADGKTARQIGARDVEIVALF
jgi:hypothetical protein